MYSEWRYYLIFVFMHIVGGERGVSSGTDRCYWGGSNPEGEDRRFVLEPDHFVVEPSCVVSLVGQDGDHKVMEAVDALRELKAREIQG